MIEIKFNLTEFENLKKCLQRAPEKTVNEMSKAVQKTALTIESNAKREAPVNKQTGGGNLRQSIRTSLINRLRATVTSHAPYSGYVEFGTVPHIIVPVNKKGLANKRTGQYFGKVVHHPGTKPNPYMQRSLDKSMPKISEYFRDALINVINSLKK